VGMTKKRKMTKTEIWSNYDCLIGEKELGAF
jgi:hypothetical protein